MEYRMNLFTEASPRAGRSARWQIGASMARLTKGDRLIRS
jgi:hypothetical protein